MTYPEAHKAMLSGSLVRLPEWTGYWFVKENVVKAFTRIGNVSEAWVDKYKDRDDWVFADDGLGFDFAILALKAGKKIAREGWNGKGMHLFLKKGKMPVLVPGLPGERCKI